MRRGRLAPMCWPYRRHRGSPRVLVIARGKPAPLVTRRRASSSICLSSLEARAMDASEGATRLKRGRGRRFMRRRSCFVATVSHDQRGARDQERGVESASRREALAAAVARRRVPSLWSEQSPSLPFCCSGPLPPLLEIRPIWSEGKEEVQTAAATRVVSCCTSHRRRCCCWRRELRLCVSDRQGWFCDFWDHRRSSRLTFYHLGPCYGVAGVLTTGKPRCRCGCSPLYGRWRKSPWPLKPPPLIHRSFWPPPELLPGRFEIAAASLCYFVAGS